MGRDLHASREVEGIIAYAEQVIPGGYYVSSTSRPGSITLSGNLSNHAKKTAVDFTAVHPDGNPWPTVDSAELLAIFEAFLEVAAHLNELIYCGPGVVHCVKRGKFVAPYACAIHHNHVHVAVSGGVNLSDYLPNGPLPTAVAEDGDRVPPVEASERTDLVPAITIPRPQGGHAVLQTRDGGVFMYDAPFYGSLVGVSPGPATALAWTASGEGYWVLQGDGAVFSFGDAQYHGGVNAGPRKEHFGDRVPIGIVARPDGTYDVVGQDVSGDASPFDHYHCSD